MKCSRTSQTLIGIFLQSNMDISTSCVRSSGQCRFVKVEGEWSFGLGDMALSPTMIDISRLRPLPLARARTQPARPAAALCTIPGAPGTPRVAAAETGRLGQVVLPDLNQPGDEEQQQRAALPCQSAGTGRSPRLPPQAVAGWLIATLDARLRIIGRDDEWPWPPDRVAYPRGVADRRAYRELVIMLATELYLRERGSLPSSDEALVGTYLKSLPDDRSPDVDDGTAPTVE